MQEGGPGKSKIVPEWGASGETQNALDAEAFDKRAPNLRPTTEPCFHTTWKYGSAVDHQLGYGPLLRVGGEFVWLGIGDVWGMRKGGL